MAKVLILLRDEDGSVNISIECIPSVKRDNLTDAQIVAGAMLRWLNKEIEKYADKTEED